MYLVINNVTTTSWNIVIYSLFVLFLGYKLYLSLKKYYKIKRANVCDGTITYFIKLKPENIEDINHSIKVKFNSPLDRTEYTIKSTIKMLPKDGKVDVIFDEADPENSKVETKFSLAENLWLVLPLLFFIYQLIKLVAN